MGDVIKFPIPEALKRKVLKVEDLCEEEKDILRQLLKDDPDLNFLITDQDQ